jgi:hypothetical protein
MKTQIISIFKKEEEIKRIVDKLRDYSFNDFKKHKYFEMSLIEKATDFNLLEETFPKFELIKTIELRENEFKQRYYGFNYELPDGTFVVIVLALNKNPPIIVNGYYAKRNYKEFEKSLKKNYRERFI